ncbi:hypothetical protein OAE03_01390 [Winogradskyella sp.]|nr:hypothetical protein [Winogradskyella sp.]
MKVFNENLRLRDFNAWSGAVDTKQVILDNEKEEDFDYLIEELFPDGLSETELNDFLWFDDDFILENLNINI